jgi:ABC-type maltose transport system permease subunit
MWRLEWNMNWEHNTWAVTAPIVILFFLTQRTFIQGITLTGTKG